MATQQQVTYVLNYETESIRSSHNPDDRYNYKFHYQIDSRGNVKIQQICQDWRGWNYPGQTRFSVNDNIPIPTYLVDMLKELVTYPSYADKPTYSSGFWDKNVINVFNKIKSGLKELANNPLDATDVKSQLDFSINKNEILQNELKEMEQKCKNIQAAYVDILKDNEKLKKEIEDLKAKNTNVTNIAKEFIKRDGARLTEETSKLIMEMKMNRLKRDRACYTNEFGPEFGPEFEPEFSDTFKTDYTHTPHTHHTPHSLQDCYHNPGGATIYTKANAMNRMVFNPLLGIYEPGDEK
jgi:hypothetical protein